MSSSSAQSENLIPDPALESKSFKQLLMEQVRARGGTEAVDAKQIFQSLVKDTLEAFLELELEQHLGYGKHDPEGRGSGNSRNGATPKTVRGDFGEIEIQTPRDRNSSFDPKIVAKRQTSVGNFGEAVTSLYARGLTTREIEQHVKDIYGVEISPQFVSRVYGRTAAADHRMAKPASRARVSDYLYRWLARGGTQRQGRAQEVRIYRAGCQPVRSAGSTWPMD